MRKSHNPSGKTQDNIEPSGVLRNEGDVDIAVTDHIYIGLGDRFDDDRRRVRLVERAPPLK